jgi:hypothetical protein
MATPAGPIPEQPKTDTSQQLSFLYKALDDNQNLIKFLDAKAAFAVALLSAMAGKVLSNFEAYFPWHQQSMWRHLIILGFGLSAIVTAVLVGLIVFPTINPALNTRLAPHSGPIFFLTQLEPKSWLRIFSRSPTFSRLVQDHGEYHAQITTADNEVLLRIVSGEVLKVSYIRQIKADRIKALVFPLVACSILFAIIMVSDANVEKSPKPTVVHVDSPLRIDGPITLSSSPAVVAPSKAAPASKSAKHARR